MRFSSAIAAIASLATVGMVTLVASPAQAQITGLFNTGVAADGVTLLSAGQTDSHYTFINGNTSTPAVVTNFQGPNPYAFASDSRYIFFNAAGTPELGTYILRLQFNLVGDPTTAQISGLYATDNMGEIQLNGVTVGPSSASYQTFTPFTITSGFVTGTNNLDFVVTNYGGPGALGVSNLRGTVTSTTAPEPGSVALVATALLPCIGIVARRRKA